MLWVVILAAVLAAILGEFIAMFVIFRWRTVRHIDRDSADYFLYVRLAAR